MKLLRHIVPASVLLWASAGPAVAQVEKVAIRTTGISCGACAAVSEISFRRMPGVDKVTISLSQETILLTYKPGAAFDPRRIREVLRPLEVGVVQFLIGARGYLEDQGGRRFFAAGKDRFALVIAGNALVVPPGGPVWIEGVLDDRSEPMEVKVLKLRPSRREGAVSYP